MVIFVGCQAAGKSTFFREQFFKTHVRVNLDMLKTRHRERRLIETCLDLRQPLVVDNTNPTARERQRYFELARGTGFRVVGCFFVTTLEEVLLRNARRSPAEVVPEIGVRGTFKKLERPTVAEGFDARFEVRLVDDGRFEMTRLMT